MDSVKVVDSYYQIPLYDFPFDGDFILKRKATNEVIFDSRKDGYNAPNCYIASLIRDEANEHGSVFCFYITEMI